MLICSYEKLKTGRDCRVLDTTSTKYVVNVDLRTRFSCLFFYKYCGTTIIHWDLTLLKSWAIYIFGFKLTHFVRDAESQLLNRPPKLARHLFANKIKEKRLPSSQKKMKKTPRESKGLQKEGNTPLPCGSPIQDFSAVPFTWRGPYTWTHHLPTYPRQACVVLFKVS
jgi:hypothetical protein